MNTIHGTGDKTKDYRNGAVIFPGFFDKNGLDKVKQVFNVGNPHKINELLAGSWMAISVHAAFRQLQHKVGLSRIKSVILLRVYLFNEQGMTATKGRIYLGQRIDYKNFLKYLDELELMGFLSSVIAKDLFKRSVKYYTVTSEGKKAIRVFSDILFSGL